MVRRDVRPTVAGILHRRSLGRITRTVDVDCQGNSGPVGQQPANSFFRYQEVTLLAKAVPDSALWTSRQMLAVGWGKNLF